MGPGAKATEDARAEVEPEGRQLLILIAAATDQEAGRCLALACAGTKQDVECDQRHEQLAALDGISGTLLGSLECSEDHTCDE